MKKKLNFTTILLILIMLAGLSLLLYPSISDYVNSLHQTKAIAEYAKDVAALDSEEYERILRDAKDYNKLLAQNGNTWDLSDEELKRYYATLDISDNGVMSCIEIPKINCSLPIYHDAGDGILQTGIGHIPGSSLPVGGAGSHCVLSGHRGLPSAKLFSDLDKLIEGDQFIIRTLDEILTYEVDQILIVLPNETDSLKIEKGKDYCTLVTCTPYGVNSHRLLIRGHRVENVASQKARVAADAIQIEPIIIAPLIAAPILLILLILVMTSKPNKSRNRRKNIRENK